ncbi:MAG: septum formation initiator family protein [Bacteroidota bacterium]
MRLPIRNPYLLVGIGFLTWMLFFDSEDLITQYRVWNQLKKLKDDKAYYLERIESIHRDREELMTQEELLEKFAREKYYMKRPTEDVYVFVD